MKERLDVLLVKRGLAASREKAKAVIMAGNVYVDNQKEDKAGTMFPDKVHIEVRGNTLKYVSRGGLKLEKAMTHFGLRLEGLVCMDVGSSTGGFTDCMLQNGATKVYAIDVGHSQLAEELLNNMKPGSKVVTIGGLHGVIAAINESANTVDIDCEGVILEFDRNAIRTVTAPATVQTEEKTTETVEETEEKE